MSRHIAYARKSFGLSQIIAFLRGDKQTVSPCVDRMAALDDPRTRKALAGLPAHLLRDIGAVDVREQVAQPPAEGQALIRHLW